MLCIVTGILFSCWMQFPFRCLLFWQMQADFCWNWIFVLYCRNALFFHSFRSKVSLLWIEDLHLLSLSLSHTHTQACYFYLLWSVLMILPTQSHVREGSTTVNVLMWNHHSMSACGLRFCQSTQLLKEPDFTTH